MQINYGKRLVTFRFYKFLFTTLISFGLNIDLINVLIDLFYETPLL